MHAIRFLIFNKRYKIKQPGSTRLRIHNTSIKSHPIRHIHDINTAPPAHHSDLLSRAQLAPTNIRSLDARSSILDRVLVALENALLDELLGARATLQALLEAVGAHVQLQLLLVALQGRGDVRVGQDVALDEVVALGARGQAFFEVVGCALALELEGFGLECSVGGGG